ncbi:MAG: response regulator transcription factor [Tissierellia bacterium]|nr:response regulator transcription factor [Tissierellia bacterium]
MANILIADDEREILRLLKMYLEADGHRVLEATDGEGALALFQGEAVDLALVDIMMPKKDGYEVIQQIRRTSAIPILVISAKVGLSDRVFGMDLGADDYITKPFEPLEVAAKVRAHLRREERREGAEQFLTLGHLVLDTHRCTVTVGEELHQLTKVEYRVLELLMREPRRIFTKEQIYRHGWGEEYLMDDNSLRVIISRLREKIGRETIKTIRGLGYRLEMDHEA